MDILKKIISHKLKEVEERKSLFPEKLLEKSIYFNAEPVSLRKYMARQDKSGVIAEFKRKSPSKGDINPYASVEEVTIGYMMARASALSILTDKQFFGGSDDDLKEARHFNYCPILRKDFMIDPYQIVEAKSIGADVILLIASCLEPVQVMKLAQKAKELQLEVMLEIHSKEELDSHFTDEVDLVGVNNRNLKTFDVSIETSLQLADLIPDNVIKVAESGISDPSAMYQLYESGYRGFLIGEHFMKYPQPEKAAMKFIDRFMDLRK